MLFKEDKKRLWSLLFFLLFQKFREYKLEIDMWFIVNILPWILSAITIYMAVLTGNKHPKSWLIGLFNQFFWLIWILFTENWGFLPMNIAFWIVYYRNHVKWTKEALNDI